MPNFINKKIEEFREWQKLNGVAIFPNAEKHHFEKVESFLAQALAEQREEIAKGVRLIAHNGNCKEKGCKNTYNEAINDVLALLKSENTTKE